ncbi:Fc.00g048560.m01.CDS01 [Cosmosporella sp. VM-42]
MTDSADFSGLGWEPDAFGFEPIWTVQPNEEAIKWTTQEALHWKGNCTIQFFDANAFNKFYVVKCAQKEVLTCVSLPVDPQWKTLSEVATLRFVRENTGISVPDVYSYSANRSNRIGFEYIIMTRMPGKPLEDVWLSSGALHKEKLVRQLARIYSEMFENKLRGIGNIYPKSHLSEQGQKATGGPPPVERIVSAPFIWADRRHQNISRGPFSTSKEWLSTRLLLAERECRHRFYHLQQLAKESRSQDDPVEVEGENLSRENLRKAFNIISRLQKQLNILFQQTNSGPETSVIFHDDLYGCNVLADDEKGLTAVVNWGCISAVPLWYACQLPCFLEVKSTTVRPVRGAYEGPKHPEDNKIYRARLKIPETIHLRSIFLGEMLQLQPQWIEIFHSNQKLRDFEFAITNYDEEVYLDKILSWLDDLESGKEKFRGLKERIADAGV